MDSQGNPEPSDSSSSSSSNSNKPRRPKRSKKSKKDDDSSSKDSNGVYYEDMPGHGDYKHYLSKRKESLEGKNEETERSLRGKPYKARPQFNTVKWEGMSATFRHFKRAIEGHLIQVGAGYLIQPAFVINYEEAGLTYLSSLAFWDIYKISIQQAHFDRQYLYGMLITATMKLQLKTIIKYEESMDGILSWQELKQEYEFDGSKELRLEQLESMAQVPYSEKTPGGMAAYIDRLQAQLAELEAIQPDDYSDSRKKRILLTNVRSATGMLYLIQKCKDNEYMSYDQSAAYLRSNSMVVDAQTKKQTPTKLMHTVKPSEDEEANGHTLETVAKLFHTMALESNIEHTYHMFNAKLLENLWVYLHLFGTNWNLS